MCAAPICFREFGDQRHNVLCNLVWEAIMDGPAESSTLEPLVSKLEYRVTLDRADREAVSALPFQTRLMKAHQFVVSGKWQRTPV